MNKNPHRVAIAGRFYANDRERMIARMITKQPTFFEWIKELLGF